MFDNMYIKLFVVLKYINGKIRDSFIFVENLQFYEDKFRLINRRVIVFFNYKKNKICNLRFIKNVLVLD